MSLERREYKFTPPKRVLSIQSAVVHGHVGNNAAVFPLQLFGLEVDAINTVQFSNHTGYGIFKGSRLNGDDLQTLIDGLKENKLIHYTHVLTGYVGTPSFLHVMADLLVDLKKSDPSLTFLIDPVLGDNGHLYVPEECVELYREKIIDLATIVTPNQTEIELLTNIKISDERAAFKACCRLHARGIRTVVLTSLDFGDPEIIRVFATTVEESDSTTGDDQNKSCTSSGALPTRYLTLDVKRVPKYFAGCGDVLSALLLAWLEKHPGDLATALLKSVSSLRELVQRSFDAGRRELLLIPSRDILDDPPIGDNVVLQTNVVPTDWLAGESDS
eukprot:161553_1